MPTNSPKAAELVQPTAPGRPRQLEGREHHAQGSQQATKNGHPSEEKRKKDELKDAVSGCKRIEK